MWTSNYVQKADKAYGTCRVENSMLTLRVFSSSLYTHAHIHIHTYSSILRRGSTNLSNPTYINRVHHHQHDVFDGLVHDAHVACHLRARDPTCVLVGLSRAMHSAHDLVDGRPKRWTLLVGSVWTCGPYACASCRACPAETECRSYVCVLVLVYVPSQRTVYLCQKSPCLLYTSPSPRDQRGSRMPSSA